MDVSMMFFFGGEGVLTYVSISASRAQKKGESDAK